MLRTSGYQVRSCQRIVAIVAIAIGVTGCSRKTTRLETPEYDPAGFTERALELYDKNSDGAIDDQEMSPGLRSFSQTADKDGNGSLSKSELQTRMQEHLDDKVALHDVAGLVLLHGQPLGEATVRFIPDEAMKGTIKPAIGVSDEEGFVSLSVEGDGLPGVQPGIYRIEVSKKQSGQELVPAKFNVDSQLGQEVGMVDSLSSWTLNLGN